MGPPCSAALVRSSAAVSTAGMLWLDEGMVLTRSTIASRRDASLTSSGSTIGSAKQLSQDRTQLRNRTEIQVREKGLVPVDSWGPLSETEQTAQGLGCQTIAGSFKAIKERAFPCD